MSYIRICQNTTDTHSTVQLRQTLTKTYKFQNRTYCYGPVTIVNRSASVRLFYFYIILLSVSLIFSDIQVIRSLYMYCIYWSNQLFPTSIIIYLLKCYFKIICLYISFVSFQDFNHQIIPRTCLLRNNNTL